MWEGLLLAFNKDTFQDGIEYTEMLNYNPSCKPDKKEYIAMLSATAKFRRPSAGVTDFSVGSLHLHRGPAKRKDTSAVMLGYARQHALDKGVTLIVGDFNMAAYDHAAKVFP